MKLFVATHNKNKLKEIKEILNNQNIELISPIDFNDNDDVEENGTTFRENAYLKAKYYFDKYHYPTISDDSGMCINCLNGIPGIYSARYSGGDYLKTCKEFIEKVNQYNDRSATFNCSVCYVDENTCKYFDGVINGEIAKEIKGSNGFGYDPIFYLKEYGKTMAEMDSEIKNKCSHRYLAFKKLGDYLNEKGI